MDKVLVIDDDRFTQNVLKKALYQSFEVRTADDGDAGMHLANQWHPNVILLDVEMPGRNGYEVCDAIKQGEATKDIPVIFLSSHNSLRERLLGFEVGGDDYLEKPCSKELLTTKVEKITDFYRQRHTLKQEATSSEKTAMEAMASNFELGKAVRFVEKTYTTSSLDKLGNLLMDVMRDLSLSTVAMFQSREGQKYYSSSTNTVAPLEMEILQMLNNDKRFNDFGCRTQINYPQVSLLIKNMPLEDRPRYGRIKDTIPFLLGATDAKIRVLDAETSLVNQNQKMVSFIEKLQQTTQVVSRNLSTNQKQVSEIMTNLGLNLSMEMHKLGMEADQEEFVNSRIEDASKQINELVSQGQSLESALDKTVGLLQIMADEQDRIITESLKVACSDEDESLGEDIELF